MKFYILAPSQTVHIHNDNYNGDITLGDSQETCCGIRVYPHVHTHVFVSVQVPTEKVLHGCKNCVRVYLRRQAA